MTSILFLRSIFKKFSKYSYIISYYIVLYNIISVSINQYLNFSICLIFTFTFTFTFTVTQNLNSNN